MNAFPVIPEGLEELCEEIYISDNSSSQSIGSSSEKSSSFFIENEEFKEEASISDFSPNENSESTYHESDQIQRRDTGFGLNMIKCSMIDDINHNHDCSN